MTIKELLNKGQSKLKEFNIEEPIQKIRIILANCLEKSKEYIMIHEDENVNKDIEIDFLKKIDKLKENVPLQYIINKAEFMGNEFFVNSNVLIPQPDTEILLEEVIQIIKSNNLENAKILDMCTGSGIIAISLKKYCENCEIIGCDISRLALDVAEKNAKKNNVKIKFIKSDLFSNLHEKEKFDIIISNPPYIKTDVIKTLSLEVQKEPQIALDGGKDGLEFYKKIVQSSKEYLKNGGILALEIGFDQKEEVINLLKKGGFINIYSKKDLGNNDRIVIGVKNREE